ncbi:MAG: alpha-ketoglutarate-dependent dioxygenase AlkB [Gammaproteobacteria bacterium]|nr:alpha-ketoglutarate-dependent dioxygenase AlkB [Gammaproteobacteria bacterium]
MFEQSLIGAIENSAPGQLKYLPQWLDLKTADDFYQQLLTQIFWQSETIRMYGREVKVPRKIAWYGDDDAAYTYSGITHQPKKWLALLHQLRERIKSDLNIETNSVLANLYRDGQDSMGWHSDNEPELGNEPNIVSLSLGQPRYFDFRDINNHQNKHRLELAHGSLLVMSGKFQQHWQHQVPKQRKVSEPRINLTFRKVFAN